MKKLLQILCLSTAIVSSACSDKTEELVEKKLKLTKLTVTDTDSDHTPFTYTYTYNEKGALYQLGEKSNADYHDNVTTHVYDNQARLTSTELLGKGYGAHYYDTYSYDANSRITGVHHTYTLLHDPTRETTPLTTRFSYNASGQISRIDKPDSGPSPYAILLTYDNKGNVVKQQLYFTTSNGELGTLNNELTFTYDDKKKPLF